MKAIHFPEDGVRATDIPPTQITVDAFNGLLELGNGDPSRTLNDSLDNDETIQSIVIFHEMDIQLKDIYNERVGCQAGWTVLQGLPEIQKFIIDASLDATNANGSLTPEEMNIEIYCFTTEYEQLDALNKKIRAVSTQESFSVEKDTWQTILLRPAFPYNSQEITLENTDENSNSNDLEYRVLTHHGGKTREVPINTDGTAVKTLNPNEEARVNNNAPAEFIELQVKESSSGNSTTADAEFTGEN